MLVMLLAGPGKTASILSPTLLCLFLQFSLNLVLTEITKCDIVVWQLLQLIACLDIEAAW